MSWSWDDDKTEKLISLIFERSALWNKTHSQCKNNYYLGKQWEDVAINMGLDKKEGKEKVRNKWRNLVQKYDSEKVKLQGLRSGAGAEEVIKSAWPHYNSMHFIKEFKSNNSTGNIDLLQTMKKSEATTSRSDTSKASTSQSDIKLQDGIDVTQDEQSSSTQNSLETTVKYPSSAMESIMFEEADWYNFLSLMPYLSEINNPKNKLKFRMEAMFQLFNYLDEKESLEEKVEIEQEVKKEIPEVKQEIQDVNDEVHILDDEDCIIIDEDWSTPNKKIKVENTYEPTRPIKQEIEASDEFNTYVKNHFAIKKE